MDATSALILFQLLITMPDHKPIRFAFPLSTIEECATEVYAFLSRPSRTLALAGGVVSAICTLRVAPSIEH